jgi:hypothetical protein
MARGGARVGAGRKPKEKRTLTLVNSRRDPTPAPPRPPADVDDELALPPTDLTPAERDVWRVWAPLALEAQTLTPATAVGFRELCTVAVLTHAIAESIELARAPGKKDEQRYAIGDALKLYTKYAQRLDGLLARFKLTAFGKPVDGAAKPTAAVNPWAEVAKK